MEGLHNKVKGVICIMLDRTKKIMLMILVLLLPYHFQVISVLLSEFKGIKLWKEIFISILLLITLIQILKGHVKYKITMFEKLTAAFIILIVVYICFSGSPYRALYISRIYFIPMLIIPAVKTTDITKDDIKRLLNITMGSTILICIWGQLQAYILKDGFLINLGYGTQRVNHGLRLKNEFYVFGGGYMQRVTGTFAAPNTFGMYLAFLIVLLVFISKVVRLNEKYKNFTLLICGITLIMTFSRTSWVACIAGLAIYYYKNIKNLDKTKALQWVGIITGAGVLVMLADYFAIHTGITGALVSLIRNTLTGQDSSMTGHLISWKESVVKVIKHPFGTGIGHNGPRALLFYKYPNLTESSYFLIMYETGIFGAVLYFSTFVRAALDNLNIYRETRKKEVLCIFAIIIMLGICYLTLPYAQDFELLVLFYLIVSNQYNDKLMYSV